MKGTRQWNERRAAMLVACGRRCWYCGREVSGVKHAPFTERASIDHKLPRDRGGGDDDANLVIACYPCNTRKGTHTVEEYRAWLGGADPHVRMAEALARFLLARPDSDGVVFEAEAWLRQQRPTIVFHGERVAT